MNESTGGVGFLLSPKACENLISVEKISPRVLILELEGNPKSTIISCYSPHNSSDEQDVDDFYSILRSVLDDVPAHNYLIIPGDFNAKLGPENANFT